jgi:hypothetical protein
VGLEAFVAVMTEIVEFASQPGASFGCSANMGLDRNSQ